MRRRAFLTLLACSPGVARADFSDWLRRQLGGSGGTPDNATMVEGIKQALEQGTARAVRELGRDDGFYHHPRLKIPVPDHLARIDKGLRKLGQSKVADEFVLSLNRAAESAVPEAKAVFVDAVRRMTVEDALGIVRGPPDAATRYFRTHTEAPLTERFLPIVKLATDRVGVTRHYKQFVDRSGPLSRLVDTRELDLDAYVTRQSLDGLYFMIGQEEKRIREDPVARTTEVLKKVFTTR